MGIKFTKMHGLGNDFIVLDGVNQSIQLTVEQIQKLANRHTGIGFDQCLLIESSQTEGIDFNYRIFNADGQEVGQCGNGARCIALFARYYGLTAKNKLTVATKTTLMDLIINEDNSVSVNMGVPRLAPGEIPLLADRQSPEYSLELNNGNTVNLHAISVGNPHAVLLVENIDTAPVNSLGQQISFHPQFPEQVNVGFMQIVNHEKINLRVYERGCGETIACGSGAVAAAAIARLFYNLSDKITVHLPGGDLCIQWPCPTAPIILTGPAAFVYEGTLLS
ncbi:diaminopimelate epimerase [Legionella pneumophila serogroup 1]|uniref:Diaminopimelate epimerase n=2 Tax=Legionella pneumophila TaxID=446 RepID=DAPF_LEGPC|nr:diaminopimelate epimerase [Legionella pneumophila]A5IHM9.1 RecName: Full=Diaminopimelate epimerase; Short=DAP epimerase; AltName: Full=PLP-independent amino acid racemase [Legionella pneumophila str. Corby]ABQ56879.1 diaminopimelate epimerase [Legionella pneumophila str. Corby]MCW8401341.1 diaminopimelate epimerase [Legionella pneumophila]MCW8435030.1 diaminopimelate epimerase [Legionella pneumophila]MCW8466316.1 diaminopimelate epimerase [Legionella pneumophila]MCW8475950.1 diaminopimelat